MHKSHCLSFALAMLVVSGCGDDSGSATEVDPVDLSQGTEAPEEPSPSEPSPSELSLSELASDRAVEIVPGERVGEVRIGMTREEVEALGMETHPRFSAMTVPVTAYYDEEGRVRSAEVSLSHVAHDVQVGDVTIPRTADVDAARALFGDCEEPDIADGATTHRCRGGAVKIMIGSGDPIEIWLRTERP